MSFLKNIKIGSRLQFVVVLAAAALVAVQAIGLTELRSTLLEDRKQKTEEHVQTAHSLIAHYHSLSEKGGLSVSEAQKSALAAVEKLRYAGKEYFWVNDMQPKMLMHPYAKKLNGKDLSGLEDPTGKKLFVEFVNTVRASKGGFVDYLWPKPGADEPVAKISYVMGFAPWNWVVGSGIYIDDVNTIFLTEIKKTLAITFGLLFLLVATTFIITLSITRRLARTTNDMETLAQGQFDFDVSYGEDKDEIGALARALTVFRDNAIKMDQLSAEKQETDRRANEEESRRAREKRETEERAEQDKRATEQKAAEEGKRSRIELADAFEKSVMGVVETLSSATAELQSSAQTMSTTAEQTSQQATAVAAASEEATVNVQTVASSAEELSASIEEISRQVTQSNQIAQNAVTEAKLTNEKVEGLADAAQKIGDVVSLINDIASQTNLLALNATIEAARAGDAGKGFAVVASEVKSLANQTGKATEEIAAQITAIQAATGEAVGAIQGIGSTIGELGEIASSVAAAVDQQGSATREIASSVQQAAAGTQEVSGNITQVTQAASESQVSSGQMLGAAKELAEQGNILRREVDKFLQEIRAA